MWQIKDVEIELEEERRRHSETQKSMRKKETRLRELILQCEDDHKTITMLNDATEKLSEKVKMYKRQLDEQVCNMLLLLQIKICFKNTFIHIFN